MADHSADCDWIDCNALRVDKETGGDRSSSASADGLASRYAGADDDAHAWQPRALRLIEPDGSVTEVPLDTPAPPPAKPAKKSPAAQAKAKREAELKAKRDAEEKAREEAAARKAAEARAKAKAAAEAKAKREAEEAARKEAEAKARREAEEQARREAEARAKAEAEEEARRLEEAKAKKEAELKAKREAEEKARKEAEAKAKREAELKAKREAEEKARKEAELKAKQAAEEKARKEAEAKAKAEAEAKAKKEAEAKAKREAEEKARREAEEKARKAAEAKAKKDAEAKAKKEAEAKAKKEAELKAKKEAELKAKREAEEQARKEAEAKAKAEAEEKAKRAAEAKAKKEAEAKAKKEADAKAKREAEEKARQEAEAKAKAEAEAKAREEAEAAALPQAITPKELAAELREEIGANGPISFAGYMARCNACYTAHRDPQSKHYTTSLAPEISPIFGELVGLWIADLFVRMGSPKRIHLVELGPERGTLINDVMRTSTRYEFEPVLHFVETSPALRKVQSEAFPKAKHHADLSSLPEDRPLLIIANEYFAAQPVHQLVRSAQGWHERVVGLEEGRLSFIAGEEPMDDMVPPSWRSAAQGTMIETSQAAVGLMREIATRLTNQGGAALIIDNGPRELRAGSTLKAQRRGKTVDALSHAGEAKLTSHVDFELLAHVAEQNGADVMGLEMQGEWLRQLGIETRTEALQRRLPDDVKDIQRRHDRLVEDGEMGAPYKVLGICGRRWPIGVGFE